MVKETQNDHWVLATSVYDSNCPKLNDSVVIPRAFEKLIINIETNQKNMYSFTHNAPWRFSDNLDDYKVQNLHNIKLLQFDVVI
jgi:hypothetical protein